MSIVKLVKMIDSSDFDDLVSKTYGRPFCFQQQDGCRERGSFRIKIPNEASDNYMHDSIPENLYTNKRGVKFKVWLDRDPKYLPKGFDDSSNRLFWDRHFYPDIQMVANDLHSKGLIEVGDYIIDIDW